MRELNENYDNVIDDVSIAYDHRSDYTHGATFLGDRASLQILNEKIWKYLRKSILIWMILEDRGYNKEQIVSCIDGKGKQSDNDAISKTVSNEKGYLDECFR